jgi:V8-like Glu-specific endopeptidase
MGKFLEVGERNRLVKVLSAVDDFAFPASRKTNLGLANLDRFIPNLSLDAPTKQFVGQLVLKLEDHGPLDDQPGVHALGALLGTVIEMDDVPVSDRKFLAEITVKYRLVVDPVYTGELRKKYGIKEQTVQPQLPAQAPMPAPSQRVAAPAPDFLIGVEDEQGLESVINSLDNFLDVSMLAGALDCARAVCLVEIPEGTPVGTGFLVGPDLVLTNQHVLPDQKTLESVAMRFDYLRQANGAASPGKVFTVARDFYHSSADDQLDYALVRLTAPPLDALAKEGKHRGYLMLSARAVVNRERVNIIQHPDGKPMQVVLTQNYVVNTTERRLQYVADTMPGSSGSPVFDRNWRVVAIHHSGKPYPPESAFDSAKKLIGGKWRVNEGVPLKPILQEISPFLPTS